MILDMPKQYKNIINLTISSIDRRSFPITGE